MSQFGRTDRQKIVAAAALAGAGAAALALALSISSLLLPARGADSDFSKTDNVESVNTSEPFDSLTARFRPIVSTGDRWLGADAAYSIPLGDNRTLWMFGDTFIRATPKKQIMINNSAAVQQTKSDLPLAYYWKKSAAFDKSLLSPVAGQTWLWPLDGFIHDGKLFEFMNEIEHSGNKDAAFSFQSVGQRLLRVNNPQAAPNAWHVSFKPLKIQGVQFGNAVLADQKHAYIFCSYMPAQQGIYKHPLIVARISYEKLEARNIGSEFEFWCHSKDSDSDGEWLKSLDNPIVLFQDGAPELSIVSIRGRKGLFAVYFPAGFSNEIMLRHAERPEGPWSTPIPIYRCPVDDRQFFVYSAKAHPELSSQDGELILTYCVNKKGEAPSSKSSPSSSLDSMPQSYYYPHAVRIMLRTAPNSAPSARSSY